MVGISDAFDICMKFFPTIQNAYLIYKRDERDQKIDTARTKSLENLEVAAANGKTLGQNQPKVKLPSGFKEGESIPDLGRRYWTGYHKVIDSLPEDATEDQVKEALEKIEKNARDFPCPSCRENAIEILDKNPLVIEGIKTKKDGQISLCEFHNRVSLHVGNKTVNCAKTYATSA